MDDGQWTVYIHSVDLVSSCFNMFQCSSILRQTQIFILCRLCHFLSPNDSLENANNALQMTRLLFCGPWIFPSWRHVLHSWVHMSWVIAEYSSYFSGVVVSSGIEGQNPEWRNEIINDYNEIIIKDQCSFFNCCWRHRAAQHIVARSGSLHVFTSLLNRAPSSTKFIQSASLAVTLGNF